MRSPTHLLAWVLLGGCVHDVEAIGGTPGPVAIRCLATESVCVEVTSALEQRRHNIGGWCGTANITARLTLEQLGAPALHYIERAFDDRDPEVAQLALDVATEVGGRDTVVTWCRGLNDCYRIEMCREALRTAR